MRPSVMLHSRSGTPTAVLVVALLPAGHTSTAMLSATARLIRPLMPMVSAVRRREASPERRARAGGSAVPGCREDGEDGGRRRRSARGAHRDLAGGGRCRHGRGDLRPRRDRIAGGNPADQHPRRMEEARPGDRDRNGARPSEPALVAVPSGVVTVTGPPALMDGTVAAMLE